MKPTNYFPPQAANEIQSSVAEIDGECWLMIQNVDAMPHFLMSIVSADDLWMFAGSNASLTGGRTSPAHSIFPYRTVDKILASRSGGNLFCSILVEDNDGICSLWEPWSESRPAPVRRNLYKHITGGGLLFEEIHEPSGLIFRWQLGFSEEFGIVKKASLENPASLAYSLRCLEGYQHLLPPGIPLEMQDRKSYLALAYMRHELAGKLAIYSINSGITDRAQPCESLRYATGWSAGETPRATLLSDRQLSAFRAGEEVSTEVEIRGSTGSYLQVRAFRLVAGASAIWWSAIDTQRTHAELSKLQMLLEESNDLLGLLKISTQKNLHALQRRIGEVDGWQLTGENYLRSHHAANALFNAMRGGLPAHGNTIPRADFGKFVAARNRETFVKNEAWIAALPEVVDVVVLREMVEEHGDSILRRLATEYLPLTFSRRHGDPSRPWNTFSLHLRDEQGEPILTYQGNWRDVFQNWEALALSYPAFLPSMIAVFLNASTADGYNAYRIDRKGAEWEVFEPEDPWSNIGYWGDHQIIYLCSLLSLHEQYFPGVLAGKLNVADYVYTDVPYRIRSWEELVKNPSNSIRFDEERHDELLGRAEVLGNDGKLLRTSTGEIVTATLTEKLLVPVLTKLANLAPGGGVWMNTQRPEWNDANNALAGWGLSLVTVGHLHRHLLVLRNLFLNASEKKYSVSLPFAKFLFSMREILIQEVERGLAVVNNHDRFLFLAESGKIAETYRAAVYAGVLNEKQQLPATEILTFLTAAVDVCRSTILASRRPDGLFHSYNFLYIEGENAEIRHLDVMLEGQVSILGSQCLLSVEAIKVVHALETSLLYRQDQHSYLLYPDRQLVPILERNQIHGIERAAVLVAMANAGMQSIAARDRRDTWRFQADIPNAEALSALLDDLETDKQWGTGIRRDRAVILAMWEESFHHAGFTGRSASMFGFEGLGSVYWHMVAKLLLAVGECFLDAVTSGAPHDVQEDLASAYYRIRSGLGFCKKPSEYGAFPSDPYSHTPAHAGAQQPGMTGQVKEEILCRFLELGVKMQEGILSFEPRLLRTQDFVTTPSTYSFTGKSGTWESLEVPSHSLAFTICQTPILYILGNSDSLVVNYTNGTVETFASLALAKEMTAGILKKSPEIAQITIYLAKTRIREK